MYHEIILENKIEDYYFKSKIYKNNRKKPSDFANRYKHGKTIKNKDIEQIQQISGIFTNQNKFKEYVETLIPDSFGLWYEFELTSPYFSSDNDELYIVQNPVLKEQISKIPMIRGSSWKGLLSSVALDKLRETIECKNYPIKDIIDCYSSFVRVFGTGTEDFRKVMNEIEKIIEEVEKKDDTKLTEKLFEYCVFNLGININIKRDETSINEQLINEIKRGENKGKVKDIFSVHKGRAIFYPAYFDRLDYEVINPHNREKRTGTNPIMYEVVPKKTKGIFQLIYIPHDGVLTEKTVLKKEIEKDKEFIKDILKTALEEKGIGAKTKLGWGRSNVDKNLVKCFGSETEECNE